MSAELSVTALVKTSDGEQIAEVDASDWIRECAGDSFLLDHWDVGFCKLGEEFMWMDYDDEPGVTEVLEHLWAAEDRGERVDVSCTISREQVMPFIKRHMPRHYKWMEHWIRMQGGDPMAPPDGAEDR